MQAHRTETTVGGDGSVTVGGLPFAEGEAVEVIVLPAAPSHRTGTPAADGDEQVGPVNAGGAEDWQDRLGPRVRALLDRPQPKVQLSEDDYREHLGRKYA